MNYYEINNTNSRTQQTNSSNQLPRNNMCVCPHVDGNKNPINLLYMRLLHKRFNFFSF